MPLAMPMMPHDSSTVRVCVDHLQDREPYGQVWSTYLAEPFAFQGIVSLIQQLESKLWLPQNYNQYRSFLQKETKPGPLKQRERERMSNEEIFQTKLGDKATFIIQIQFRQNATWQGTIQWVERKRTQRFRSTLEMIKLMDSAMADTVAPDTEDQTLPAEWEEE